MIAIYYLRILKDGEKRSKQFYNLGIRNRGDVIVSSYVYTYVFFGTIGVGARLHTYLAIHTIQD